MYSSKIMKIMQLTNPCINLYNNNKYVKAMITCGYHNDYMGDLAVVC